MPVSTAAAALRLGGITPFTTIDFPGKLAAVLFCQGCPWRCAYCHNPHLLRFGSGACAWEEALDFLQRRRGLLEAVVFSGGEPLAQPALAQALAQTRDQGFAVGLHTGGVAPRRFARVLAQLDWVGFDIKAPRAGYTALTGGGPRTGDAVFTSLRTLLDAGTAHEIRTTVAPDSLDGTALRTLAEELRQAGVQRWTLQRCRTPHCRPDPLDDPALLEHLATRFEGLTLR